LPGLSKSQSSFRVGISIMQALLYKLCSIASLELKKDSLNFEKISMAQNRRKVKL
jgi:hypothetical protein